MSSPNVVHILASLLEGQKYNLVYSPSGRSLDNQQISSVTVDSREVVAGSLFVALVGVISDGHNYIESAVAAGCRAIVCGPGSIQQAHKPDEFIQASQLAACEVFINNVLEHLRAARV